MQRRSFLLLWPTLALAAACGRSAPAAEQTSGVANTAPITVYKSPT
jgi:hypothetical protein